MSYNPFGNLGMLGASVTQQSPNQGSYSAAMAQNQAYNQALMGGRCDWMIDGEPMTLEKFANTLWPEDCKEKTFFYLKYSK